MRNNGDVGSKHSSLEMYESDLRHIEEHFIEELVIEGTETKTFGPRVYKRTLR